MKNITNEILEEIKQSDFSSEDLKTIQGIFENFDISSLPNLKPTEKKVRKKIEREIENREEKEKIDFIKNLPRFAKWRLRLTGFVSAFVIFLFLFVSTFFSNFFTGKIIVEENVISLEDQSFTEFKKAEVSPTL
ncbi:hypothetical protein IJM86_08560 [bacterium]|nr:hypothetical protein [bacterium]